MAVTGSGAPTDGTDTLSRSWEGSGAPTDGTDTLNNLGGGPARVAVRDGGLNVEAWNKANTERQIATVPFVPGTLAVQKLRKPPGDGAVTIPASYDRLDELFDPLGTVEPVVATGGTKTQPGDGYVYHEFTADDDFVVTRGGLVDFVVVGAGGGGAATCDYATTGHSAAPAGGGGGGAVEKRTGVFLPAGTYPVTVGTGGTGGSTGDDSALDGSAGGDSTFNGVTASGGGPGVGHVTSDAPSADGAGGGGSWSTDAGQGGTGAGGGDGGDSSSGGTYGAGGGAGGGDDGQDGTTATSNAGGDGGDGTYVDEFSGFGDSGTFAGGGGGGQWGSGNSNNGSGGAGGGQDGGDDPDNNNTPADHGGGGGGAKGQQFFFGSDGGDGANGTVIVRYPESSTGPLRALLKVYEGGIFRYGWFPDKIDRPYGEDSPIVTLSGRGQEAMAAWAYLPPPAWDYGYDGVFSDSFEQSPNLLTNPGLDAPFDGSYGDPVEGWTARGSASINVCSSCSGAPENGSNVIAVNPNGVHSGLQQTVDVEGGERYVFTVRYEGEAASDQRVTIGLAVGGADAADATIHTADAFIYDGEILAEPGNVARNPSENGCPGGELTGPGTVDETVLDVTVPDDATSLTVFVQYDTHAACTQPSTDQFNLHSAELTGFGVDGWTARARIDEFTTDDTYARTGTYSMKVVTDSEPGNHSWDVDVATEPDTEYSIFGYARTSGQIRFQAVDPDDGSGIAGGGLLTGGGSDFETIPTLTFTATGDTTRIRLLAPPGNESTTYHIDDVVVSAGRPPSSPGDIISSMLTEVQDLGFLPDLTIDFDGTYDSNGELWRSTSIVANFGYGGTLKAALDRIASMGYEWTIEPPDFRLGYDVDWVLRLFNGYQED